MGRRIGISASQAKSADVAGFTVVIHALVLVGFFCAVAFATSVLEQASSEPGPVQSSAVTDPVGEARSSGSSEQAGGLAADPAAVINEVLYDPAGTDRGLEFVELFNPSGTVVRLEGWALETGNGSYADRWTLEWTGGETDTIGPRSFFVIGEEMVSPRPQAVTDLDLQNGPDACRLVSNEGIPDVVGWGDHVHAEYYEEEPASAVSSGRSLGRDPDGEDTNDNAADFIGLARPSPGDFNHAPCDLALLKAGLSRYAAASSPDLDITCVITNLGAEPCGEGAMVWASLGAIRSSSLLAEHVVPAATAKIVVRLPSPGKGLHIARLWLECESDRWRANDSISTSVMVPPSPVVVNEVMFRPAGRDCEWVEIFNHSARPYSLSGWRLEDSGGKPRIVSYADLVLEAGGFAVLVESEEAFAATYGDSNGIVFLKPKGGWPTLNDVDGPLGFADAFVLRDSCGTTVDSVVYGQSWSGPGLSVERVDPEGRSTAPSNWSPHYGRSAGSPGMPNSVSLIVPHSESILSLSPATFTPDGDGRNDLVAISVQLPAAGSVRVSVFDLNGRLVKRLVDGETVEAMRVTFWDGRDDHGSRSPVGIYVVGLEAEAAGGSYRAKSPLVLTRR